MHDKPDVKDDEIADSSGIAVRSYRIEVGGENLNFRQVEIEDSMPTGRQILEEAGLAPVDEHSLFAILPSGDFEDVRLDEPFDLRDKGAERFVAFRSDRDFRLTLNDREIRWGAATVSGATLYILAGSPQGQAVFLDARGGEDRLIESDELIDLASPGVERFVTTRRSYKIVVNAREKTVPNRDVSFEQIIELAFPGASGPNVDFTMTYRHAASKPHAGELFPGGVVQVKNGSVFNVTRTVQS